jgi:hypothetical protein
MTVLQLQPPSRHHLIAAPGIFGNTPASCPPQQALSAVENSDDIYALRMEIYWTSHRPSLKIEFNSSMRLIANIVSRNQALHPAAW